MKNFRVLLVVGAGLVAGWLLFGSAVAAQEDRPYQQVTVPERVEAEHYDIGESGVAWSDTDGHLARGNFRSDDAVDAWVIEGVGASGQTLLGRTRDGEFVQYTVEVAEPDQFEIRLRVASGAEAPGVIDVAVDGESVGVVDGDTDRWFDWQTRSAGVVQLDAGTHVIQLTWADGAEVNLDWIDVRSTTPPPAQCAAGMHEAEDAVIAGRFETRTFFNDGLSRGGAVGVTRGSGGYWAGVGDNFIEFCASVPTAGEYRIDATLMAPGSHKSSFFVTVDDGPLVEFVGGPTESRYERYPSEFGTFIVNDARALDPLFVDETPEPIIDVATWDLAPGDHLVRFYLRRDGVFLDRMEFTPADAPTCEVNGRPAPTNLDQATCSTVEILVNDLSYRYDFERRSTRPEMGYSGDPCAWSRVTCDSAGASVIGLRLNLLSNAAFPVEATTLADLESLEVVGDYSELPPEIQNLTRLKALSISARQMSSLPSEMENLTSLSSITVRSAGPELLLDIASLDSVTSLTYDPWSSVPAEIGELSNLTSLHIECCSSELPPEIWNLVNLRSLTIEGADYETLPREIGNLTNLTHLDLSSNDLVSLPPVIGDLVNLTSLDVSRNELVSLPSEFGDLVSLRSLDLSDNELDSWPPEIGSLVNLEYLDIGFNGLWRLPVPPEIADLPNLETLLR